MRVAKWGNSLAIRIPVKMTRVMALREGALIELSTSSNGIITLSPVSGDERNIGVKEHFGRVNARLRNQPASTPSTELLREDARY
ncbi:AbrB/MazE/SpoVT family DNA-binding domain-containing protein [Acidithiobacillus concretivorus]|uniref:AbrB/MazE/SpoVT family DNA-binding domain-containing protein n=1 Tax=Acidithiobacillus concretivorus TaxID=3063952 RepID=A0ABS5ZMK6_9PROT|nr:AbrB/MazE/SpoVT family DNA-binding domain-containing protein [Acidithiobacillus concretivorus]